MPNRHPSINLALQQGYAGAPNDYNWSSTFWEAWTIGNFFREEKREPVELKKYARNLFTLSNGRAYKIVYRNGENPRVECVDFNY